MGELGLEQRTERVDQRAQLVDGVESVCVDERARQVVRLHSRAVAVDQPASQVVDESPGGLAERIGHPVPSVGRGSRHSSGSSTNARTSTSATSSTSLEVAARPPVIASSYLPIGLLG